MEILCEIFLTTDTKGNGREHVPSCCIARDGWRHYRSTAIPTFASPHQPVFAAISPFPSLSIFSVFTEIVTIASLSRQVSLRAVSRPASPSGQVLTPRTRTGGSGSNSISYTNCQPTSNIVVGGSTCTTDVTFPVKRRERNEGESKLNLQEIRQEGMEGAAVATYCSLSLRLSGKSSQHHRQEKTKTRYPRLCH